MLATREEQLEEAILRMRGLRMSENCIKTLKEDGKVWQSERSFAPGLLYEVNESTEDTIKKIEKETNSFVYHCILNNTEFGKMLTYLLVSGEIQEWETEHNQTPQNTYAFSYVENIDDPYMSEYGTVGVMPANGGLMRVA